MIAITSKPFRGCRDVCPPSWRDRGGPR